MSISERARNTGCWAIGLYAFSLFFAIGAVVSFLNIDLVRAAQGAALTGLALGGGIWFAQKHRAGKKLKNQERGVRQ